MNEDRKREIHRHITTLSGRLREQLGVQNDSDALCEKLLHSIEAIYPLGTEERTFADFCINQIKHRQIATPQPRRPERSEIEYWQIVHSSNYLGDQITLQTLIATGATSEVWLAESKFNEKSIVFKYVNSPNLSPKTVSGLALKELQNLFRLHHPNVVEVYDAGIIRSPNNRESPFVMMEHIDGKTLQEWITHRAPTAATPSSRRDAAIIIAALSRAMHFLHSQKMPVLHLDIKPVNIMMRGGVKALATPETPILIDFGSGDSSASDGPFYTPPYAAPERLIPGAVPDNTWDIFSLGAVLYFMVTGKHLDPTQKTSQDAWNSSLERIDLGDRDLTTICRKCLAFVKDDRYGSALDIAEDLDAWLSDHPLPHARKNSYSWWEKEQLLWKRAKSRDDVRDHMQIIGRIMLLNIIPVFCLGAGHVMLFAAGIQPNVAFYWANNVAIGLAILLFCMCAYYVRFKRSTLKVLEPSIAYLIAVQCFVAAVMPKQAGWLDGRSYIPSWQEFIDGAPYEFLLLTILLITLASSSSEYRRIRPVGWTMLFCSFFLRPMFESQYGVVLMPVIFAAAEATFCLTFALSIFDAAKHEGASSVKHPSLS